jgi:hypothetical protein
MALRKCKEDLGTKSKRDQVLNLLLGGSMPTRSERRGSGCPTAFGSGGTIELVIERPTEKSSQTKDPPCQADTNLDLTSFYMPP